MIKRSTNRRSIPSLIKLNNKGLDPVLLLSEARSERIDSFGKIKQDRLALYYTGLAAAIATRFAYKWPEKGEDILCVAILAMLEIVEKALPDHDVDHIQLSKWIHKRVFGAISNYLSSDYVVKPPHTTKSFMDARKVEGDDLFLRYQYLICLDRSNDDGDEYVPREAALVVADSSSGTVVADYLKHWTIDSIERKVMELHLADYTDREIADEIGKSPARVGQIRKEVSRKLRNIVTGNWSNEP